MPSAWMQQEYIYSIDKTNLTIRNKSKTWSYWLGCFSYGLQIMDPASQAPFNGLYDIVLVKWRLGIYNTKSLAN